MDIRLYNEQVDEATRQLQMLERCRNYFRGDDGLWLQIRIPQQQAVLAAKTEERQEILDNPHRKYWRIRSQIQPTIEFFRQLKYIPYRLTKPDLDLALEGISTDCEAEVQQMISDFGATKVWMTIQVRYEPAIPQEANRQGFDQYLSCTPTQFFRHVPNSNGIIPNHEREFQLLADRIKQHNAKFIREKSGFVLAKIHQLILRGIKYAPLAGRGFKDLPEFLK